MVCVFVMICLSVSFVILVFLVSVDGFSSSSCFMSTIPALTSLFFVARFKSLMQLIGYRLFFSIMLCKLRSDGELHPI